mmetsp:Transcript_13600/g.20606  ORF Transcript_13600/g.20606 Transcript_13600/m.20606 type:complete len:118 (+) Transcript_13600:45-398(+)|eukprot:CAMPEP_0117418392 /NCGR_PEP_ID=MMETSP0758-20121206/186_1 /TAXON_ID=63605 /ORGANISM="Percolomonas cosmopolitus, Strain AE-1 (ATCC 50343)" /LENGTH=117 /DNA_ID=CAMNT_0005198875 /DNA_START=37 /DNA_END=390 /DNA_ORIENTATION=+
MSMKYDKEAPAVKENFNKIRITLSSRNVKAVEQSCAKIVKDAKTKELKVKGPIRLPTSTLRITTRKSPCGEGTNTWDRFQMRVYKRIIDLYAPSSEVAKIASVPMESGVEVDVSMDV